MTDRDPSIHARSSTPHMTGVHRLDPTASSYTPEHHPPDQVSAAPSPYLEARILNMEEELFDLRGEVDRLTGMYHDLRTSVDQSKKIGCREPTGSCQEQDPIQSHQSAMELLEELDQLRRKDDKSVAQVTDVQKVHSSTMSKCNASVPAHLRTSSATSSNASSKSVPPHLRGKKANGLAMYNVIIMFCQRLTCHSTKELSPDTSPNDRLVTDGPVDAVTQAAVPAPEPSPPSSPSTVVQQDLVIDNLSLTTWMPRFIAALPTLSSATKIPAISHMVTFHPQFLEDTLAGTDWSPGLRFVPGDGTCILKNRTYYLLSPATEPYLPEKPGQHGAKLTAFFNRSPEDFYGDLPDGANSYENVPMFVEHNGRYAYFGNYSQTRWSDKLDYDTMVARVPQHVKEFWATELTSSVRQDWVTNELKNHFFKKPEYMGRTYAASEPNAPTVTSEEEIKLNDRMAKDVIRYVEELREWDREASMKTALIKKQFILDAFDAVSHCNSKEWVFAILT
jgi:hypothetical protein